MYLIDTNIIIWLIRGDKKYEEIIQRLKFKAPLSISSVTVAEVYKNIFPTEFIETENVLSKFEIWDMTYTIAKQAGLYWKDYVKRFQKLHIIDCIIAATAQEHDLTLLTLNTRRFPMPDIKVLDPLAKS